MNVNFAPEILIKDQLDLRIRSTETGGLRSSLRAKKATEFAALWVEAWNSSRSQCWRTNTSTFVEREPGIFIAFESDGSWREIAHLKLKHEIDDERKIVVLRSDASDKTAKQNESDDHLRLADRPEVTKVRGQEGACLYE